MALKPLRLIGASIEVSFDEPSVWSKSPGCPHSFVWRGETYRIAKLLSQWRDFTGGGGWPRL